MLTPGQIRQSISIALESIDIPGLDARRGQARDNFDLSDGRRVLIATDRFTVFDQHVGQVPYKGQVLNQLTNWWFEQTADIVPNHIIDVLDPSAIVLGGGVSNLEILYDEGVARVADCVFNDELTTPILKNALGDSAGVLGAALLALGPDLDLQTSS